MKNEIKYHCPGFISGLNVYRELIIFRLKYPEYFYDNFIIDTIFDSFPGMIWNGGGLNLGSTAHLSDVDKILDYYDELNIALQLTCTNPCLIETDVYDRYCNAIVERFIKHPLNSVLVSSDILEKYLRNKYEGIKIDFSIVGTTQPNNINSNFNELAAHYNRIVLPRVYGKDFDYLNKIEEKNRDKIEILCTDPCPIDCPRLASHYCDYGKITLYEESNEHSPCTSLDRDKLFTFQYKDQQISYEELDKYLDIDFQRFKLSGRRNDKSVIHNMVLYTTKPEYQYEMVFYLLSKSGGTFRL